MSASVRCVSCGVLFANFGDADETWARFKAHACFKNDAAAFADQLLAIAKAGRLRPLPGGLL